MIGGLDEHAWFNIFLLGEHAAGGEMGSGQWNNSKVVTGIYTRWEAHCSKCLALPDEH